MGKISQLLGVKNVIVVFLLSLMFLNFRGYWYVFAMLPIMYTTVSNEIYRAYDKIFILFLLFGVWYSIFAPPLSTNEYVVFVIVYPMLYLVGKLLGATETDNSIINILFVMAMSIALIYIVSIFADVSKYGFYSETRNLEIEGRGSGAEISATGIYSNLILSTLFIVALFTKLKLWKRLLFASFAILAFVASVRVGSRSSIVITICAIAIFLLLNFRTVIQKNLFAVSCALVLILVSVNYVINNYEDELMVLERFQDEDVETGGGRVELANVIINELTQQPFGKLEHVPYAHNLWLDTARVAGIIPMFLLIIITIYFIGSIWRTYKQKMFDSDYRSIIVTIGIVLFIYMNTEPILEGAPMLFAFFVVLCGIMQGANKYRVNNA